MPRRRHQMGFRTEEQEVKDNEWTAFSGFQHLNRQVEFISERKGRMMKLQDRPRRFRCIRAEPKDVIVDIPHVRNIIIT